MKLTLFYDGFCPLCVAEMTKLKAYDKGGNLNLEDLKQLDFDIKGGYIFKNLPSDKA